MTRLRRRTILAMPLLALIGARASWAPAKALESQHHAKAMPRNVGWPAYGGDLANTRYSPIDQLTASNFNDLEVAWRFRTEALGPQAEYNLQVTPLVVNGVLFATAGTRRSVVALDAGTGELLWMHRLDEGERARRAPRRLSGRGLAYWTDGSSERILYVTIGYQLVALDAKTGLRDPAFGDGGVIDLKKGLGQDVDPIAGDIGLHATPCVANDVVIVGAAHTPGARPRKRDNVKGYVRAFDVRTGRLLWTFHTIPQKGEFGYESWLDGAERVGNAGVWCQISVDTELNLAYLGVELPTGDTVGIYRRGDGLFGESIVAVDLYSGERKWHYQTVHHGLWDYDIACAPILVDLPHDGKVVKALALPSKQAFLYVLNRETGEPIWPIPERPVPSGNVPGEWYASTQPHPSKPPAFDVQGISEDLLIDFTPELRAEAVRLVRNYRIGPLFTPPSMFDPDGEWGTITAPSLTGGANWPGGSYDPDSHMVYIHSKTEADVLAVASNQSPEVSDFEYLSIRGQPRITGAGPIERNGFRPGELEVQGLPLLKPPYGRITAIDIRRGEIAWQIAHGSTPDEVANHPALEGMTIPRTGRAGIVGPLTTKTLVICGEPGFATTDTGERGAMLRAYDKQTGEEKGAVYMPAPQTGSPMTYLHDGRQYLVLAIGGGTYGSELVAFRLPS
jgi:quinoprotein glucose dehydrogenase